MAKPINLVVDEELKDRSDKFISKVDSKMHLKSDVEDDFNSLEWLDIIEEVCPYIDNIILQSHSYFKLFNNSNSYSKFSSSNNIIH